MVEKNGKHSHMCRICKVELRNHEWIGPSKEGYFYCPPGQWQECENRSIAA